MKTILTVKNLAKEYGKFQAVKDVSFEIKSGEVFALIGPNGAGKSTTLKILSTVIKKTSGEVKINDYYLDKSPEGIRKIISYLPEEAGVYKNMTGIEYLTFMADLYTQDKTQKHEFIAMAKETSQLREWLNKKVSTYSKGMTRKLLLARAIMIKPVLAILDEPTSGLDITNALVIRKIIKGLAKQGMAVLLSSHNMLEIEFLSDRVGIIHQGEIIETGKPSELKSKYKANNLEEVFANLTQNTYQKI